MSEPTWSDRPWEREPAAVAEQQKQVEAKKRAGRGCLWFALIPVFIVAAIVIQAFTADDPHSEDVSRAQFEAAGQTWPLTVDAGTLECPRANWVIFTPEDTNTNYAVNGLAKGTGVYADLDTIWADNPDVDGLKVDASDLTDAGLALC